MTPHRFVIGALVALSGCAGAPNPPDWQVEASDALEYFRQDYLVGRTAAAEAEFEQARASLRRTGRADLVARAELVRCAVRTASLELDDCPAFQPLRDDAGPEERAYADYLAGKGSYPSTGEPLSRLVATAVALRKGTIAPAEIDGAVQIASAQGWARPLLAWLGVQAKRAEDAGDRETAARVRKRMDLISR